jgi:hypothetical protein
MRVLGSGSGVNEFDCGGGEFGVILKDCTRESLGADPEFSAITVHDWTLTRDRYAAPWRSSMQRRPRWMPRR